MSTNAARLARTIVQLRPSQPLHRVRLRTQQAALRRFPAATRQLLAATGPAPGAATGWPQPFRPVDARTPSLWPTRPELQGGKISLLGQARELEDTWRHADAPRLWRFHLYYWDWAHGLAADLDRSAAQALFSQLWRSWQAAVPFGDRDAWHPYPTALRTWSWCALHRDLVAGTALEPEFLIELALDTSFLRRHLEYDVGGNHLLKNLKALAGVAVFFADERLLRSALRRLRRELARQILPDGGHYERSPAYHAQVLGDLIDVAGLLQAAGRTPDGELTTVIEKMRRWLGAVLTPDGQVPMLNDGYPVDRELLTVLSPDLAPRDPLVVLDETGLVRATAGGWHLLADVGPPCPRSLPGHAHADTFGSLLFVDGVPLLVDTGTSTYEPGPVRGYERSTAAHSTVSVDGADSTEVWGAFRAGRRARVSGLATRVSASGITCEAVHDGFRALPGRPRHRRRWSLTSDGLRVCDTVTGRGRHDIAVRWQLPPTAAARVEAGQVLLDTLAGTFAVTISAPGKARLEVRTRQTATGFGATADAPTLTCGIEADLPVSLLTTWSRQERVT